MLTILSAVFGFAAPSLPVVFKTIQAWMDNKHELEMFRLRLQAGAQEHLWRMEEINAHADIEEARVLHQPQQSFGVQVLDAAARSNWGPWATVPAFYLFTLLDFLSGLVRPAITCRLRRLPRLQVGDVCRIHRTPVREQRRERHHHAVGRTGLGGADPGAVLLVRPPPIQGRLWR